MNTINSTVVEDLFKINAYAQNAITVAQESVGRTGGDVWQIAYGLVFSEDCSSRAYTQLKDLGIDFDYYDPDSSYEDDIRAFADALNSTCERIALFHPDLAKEYFPELSRNGSSFKR